MINERYIIKNKLGEGRSKVFLCNDIEYPSEDVAIKIISDKADAVEIENFQNEFITLRRLKHPNIVQAVNFGTVVKVKSFEKEIKTGSQFFTLEYFNGQPLLDYDGIKNEDVLRKIITQICSTLFYLHQSDYIYYDLKPDNILVKNGEGEPSVKLIDLGFAEKNSLEQDKSNSNEYVRGTAEYIAPELLKKEKYDNRVDLYSLGIILYRIVYKKFPFDTNNELKIYKAHLEKDFDFKKSNYSKELIDIIKKLLEKEPGKRYKNSLEVLSDLNVPFSEKLVKDWSPAKIFVNRKDVLNILDTYINDKTSSEIFSIKGFEGGGKTALSEEVNFIYKNAVLINYDKSKSGYQFLKYFLNKIIFNDFVFPNISDEVQKNIDSIFRNSPSELIDELKGIFAKITRESNFILILDDFNNYDKFTVEMLKDILPILQVNKIKIIVTEDSDYDYISDSFHNVKEINLTPFTDVQVSELLNKSYNKFFPVEDLKKIILLYADLLPGSIEGFIKDCLQLNIFKFTPEKITIDVSEKTAELLKSSHDQIYEVRMSSLSENGIEAVKILSLFDLNLDEKILADLFLSELLQFNNNKISSIVEELRDNNILHSSNIETKLQFTSEGIKRHVYSKIERKKEYHLKAGKILKRNYPDFDRNELSRQFELGEDYNTCYEILMEEIQEAEKVSALSYKKGILKHLQNLPLDNEKLFEINFELSKTLKRSNEYKNCVELTNKLLSEDKGNIELLIQKGICLISLKEVEEGKELLSSALSQIKDPVIKEEIRLEIAYADFDMQNYEDAEKICNELIQNKELKKEIKAKTYNLMALIQIYFKNDLDSALRFFSEGFEIFKELKMSLEMSKIEVNIGNIYNIQNMHNEAEFHWNSAIDINLSIGNILQEAYTKINFGIYYYNNFFFEKAIEQYNRAYNIYNSLGDNHGIGMVANNLGETYLIICDYQKCINSLEKAKSILNKLQIIEEEFEALFLLGELFFIIGAEEKFKNIIQECLNLQK
ncbi:MAG: protein kinase, partial [Ignavibacteriaceae bacterium]